MIPDAMVDEVRARADIVEIIGEHVSLKRSGKDFKARCPFHEERTPSFYVIPSKRFYNCFGCHESGDVFTFLMKRLGLSFVDAVKYVAERTGMEIREVSRQGEEDPYRHLYEANAFAREFFTTACGMKRRDVRPGPTWRPGESGERRLRGSASVSPPRDGGLSERPRRFTGSRTPSSWK